MNINRLLLTFLFLLSVPLAQADRFTIPYTVVVSSTSGTAITADRYFIFGDGANSATEANTQVGAPVNGIVKELRCRTRSALASDESWTYSLRVNGVTTALGCTIGNSAQTCTDLLNTVPVAIGDPLNFLADNTAGGSPSMIVFCTVVMYDQR